MDEQKTVGARVYHDSNQDIPFEAHTPLMFNSVRYDTDNIHDLKNNTRLTCRTSGIYLIVAMCIWDNLQPLSMAQLTIKLNDGYIIGTDRQYVHYGQLDNLATWFNPFNTCTTIWQLKEGDYVEAAAHHDNAYIVGADRLKNLPVVRRADHLDSPEFMMHLLR